MMPCSVTAVHASYESFDRVCFALPRETYSAQDDKDFLAPIYLPVSITLKPDLQKAILGIVTLAALGALQIPAPGRTVPVVVF